MQFNIINKKPSKIIRGAVQRQALVLLSIRLLLPPAGELMLQRMFTFICTLPDRYSYNNTNQV